MAGNAVNYGGDGCGWHKGRRAAAKKDAADRAARQTRGGAVNLIQQGPAPGILVDAFADVAVEITVGAFRQAKRPVQIDREAPLSNGIMVRGSNHRSAFERPRRGARCAVS